MSCSSQPKRRKKLGAEETSRAGTASFPAIVFLLCFHILSLRLMCFCQVDGDGLHVGNAMFKKCSLVSYLIHLFGGSLIFLVTRPTIAQAVFCCHRTWLVQMEWSHLHVCSRNCVMLRSCNVLTPALVNLLHFQRVTDIWFQNKLDHRTPGHRSTDLALMGPVRFFI